MAAETGPFRDKEVPQDRDYDLVCRKKIDSIVKRALWGIGLENYMGRQRSTPEQIIAKRRKVHVPSAGRRTHTPVTGIYRYPGGRPMAAHLKNCRR